MNDDDILNKIKAFVTDIIEVDASLITPGAKIREDLQVDSLALAEVVMAIEDEYNMEFSKDHILALETVADLIEAIKGNTPTAATDA